jgi:hypothetical protein
LQRYVQDEQSFINPRKKEKAASEFLLKPPVTQESIFLEDQ